MTKATIFHLDPDHPNLKRLSKAVEALQNGEIIIYPTDTVYGIACDITSIKAINRLYAIKNLSKKHLFSFVCSDVSQASNYVHIDNEAFSVLRRILPGPYTVILEAKREVPKVLLQKRKTVGIRIPDSPVANYLTAQLGKPLVSSSITDENGEAIMDPDEIYKVYGQHASVFIEQGYLGYSPSTVLAYEDGEWEILREGKGPVDFIV